MQPKSKRARVDSETESPVRWPFHGIPTGPILLLPWQLQLVETISAAKGIMPVLIHVQDAVWGTPGFHGPTGRTFVARYIEFYLGGVRIADVRRIGTLVGNRTIVVLDATHICQYRHCVDAFHRIVDHHKSRNIPPPTIVVLDRYAKSKRAPGHRARTKPLQFDAWAHIRIELSITHESVGIGPLNL